MYINNDIDYLKFLKDKKVIIFGAGRQGQKVLWDLSKHDIVTVAFCDNDVKKQNQLIRGVKIISFDELLKVNDVDTMIIISTFERELKKQLLMNKVYNFILATQIDFGGGEEYYDEQYFKWQQSMGEFGSQIKVNMFKPYIKKDMTVVEFGSGGGYLLALIDAKEKIGIEINDSAREAAKEIGIKSVKNIKDLPDNFADVIISTSVLEHVENPLGALRELHNKLKKDGKIIFHVPNESCDTEYTRSDVNNHFYTWNCLNIGNLFKAAGYFVQSVQKIQEIWPENCFEVAKEVSPVLFDSLCSIGGKAFDANRCLIVACK
ncbi:MAG: methyltransferase domain-containing protein [Lachnospiraceae bacterium]|nr:methyltransferase domain-containing protein [Lachnospiraceae bacterium]